MSIENPNPGKVCYTYGWGLRNFTKEEPETMSNQLMQLEVELDAVEFCRNKFIGSGFSDEFIMCGRPRKHTGRTMEVIYLMNLISSINLFSFKCNKIFKIYSIDRFV